MPSPSTPATRKSPVQAKPALDSNTSNDADADDSEERSKGLLKRALAARELALEAVKLDGSTEAQEAMKTPDPCNGPLGKFGDANPDDIGMGAACVLELAQKLGEAKSRQDILNREPMVRRMEMYATGAMERAKKRSAQASASSGNDAGESPVDAAANKVAPECEKSLPACEKKCRAAKEESGPYCLVAANMKVDATAKNPDPKELQAAADMMQIACNLKFGRSSCESAAKIRELIPKAAQAQAKAKASAFDEVVGIADDLAAKVYIMTTAAKLGGRAARQVPRMRLVIQEQTKEQFCPAKKTAIQAMGAAEFNKRAAAHCKDEPPTAGGLSGPVTLPNECRAVFASACP